MTRRLTMTRRWDLAAAGGERYRRSERNEKRQILDEFIQLTGSIRVLRRATQRQGRRLASDGAMAMRFGSRSSLCEWRLNGFAASA
jgi:hypothetical protein